MCFFASVMTLVFSVGTGTGVVVPAAPRVSRARQPRYRLAPMPTFTAQTQPMCIPGATGTVMS